MKATLILIADALVVIFLAMSFFIPSANAYYYEYRSDCGTGFGGSGTAVQCEAQPLKIPEDCAFKLTQPPDANSRLSILQNESWQGVCGGELQQITTYMPDTTLKQIYSVSCNNNPTWTYQYLAPPQDTLSGYGRCLPSVNIQCRQNNTLIVSCWRNSPQLIVNPSFEVLYTTPLLVSPTHYPYINDYLNGQPDYTYIPNWYLTGGKFASVGNDSWWGKAGSQYYYMSTGGGYQVNLFQDVYIPSDLGYMYNVSFNLDVNAGTQGYYLCSVGLSVDLYFSDSTHYNLVSHQLALGWYGNSPYNSSFIQTLNIGNHTGWSQIRFTLDSANCMGYYSVNSFKLDNVQMTSQCVGTSPNCWNEFQNPPFYYPEPTTIGTTTTISGGIPPTGCNVCDPMATSSYGIVGYLFTGLCLLVTLIVCDTLLFALLVVFFILVTIFMYIKGVFH